MKYEDKSDYEINKEVSKYWDVISKYLGLEDTEITFNDENETVYVIAENGVFEWLPVTYFDPCNNPNDAEPIILETCMTIELAHPLLGGIGTNTIYNPQGMDWQCDYTDNSQWMRAAMICFLNMKDEEKREGVFDE